MTTPTTADHPPINPIYRELYETIPDSDPRIVAAQDMLRGGGRTIVPDPDALARAAHQARMRICYGNHELKSRAMIEALSRPILCPACGGSADGRTLWDARCARCQDVALLLRAEAAAADVLPDGRSRRDAVIAYNAEREARATA